MAIMFNPDILPESADPEYSTRYGNVSIVHEKIECCHNEITFYDNISKDNTFIIEDKSPEYDGYECHVFKGEVIKEVNGGYSWWKSMKKNARTT